MRRVSLGYLRYVVAMILSLLAGSSYAQQNSDNVNAEDPLARAVAEALILGCVPNAMGIHPFEEHHKAVLDKANITLTDDVPVEARRIMAQFPGAKTAISKVAPNHIVLVSMPQLKMCRVGVMNMEVAKAWEFVRQEATMKGAPWKLSHSETKNGIQTEQYAWDNQEMQRNMVLSISGPTQTVNNGKGMQLMVTIAQTKANKKLLTYHIFRTLLFSFVINIRCTIGRLSKKAQEAS